MLDPDFKNVFPGKPEFIGDINLNFKRTIDSTLLETLNTFIKDFSDKTSLLMGLDKAVVGLSGGVDSIVISALLKKALGEKAIAVIVDFDNPEFSESSDNSIYIAEKIDIEYKVIKASNLLKEHLAIASNNSAVARLHLHSRLINNLIFQIADNNSAIVIDTTDKSERILARHAECFMGHISPLADLYKSEVYDLLNYMLPNLDKKPEIGCPQLSDIDAFGVGWDVLDKILYLIVEKGSKLEDISNKYRMDISWLERINNRIKNQHLRIEGKKIIL